MRPRRAVGRQERRPLGEVKQDRVRFRQEVAGCALEHRRPPGDVHGHELVGQRLAGEDVDRNALVVSAELSEQQANLVAVGRSGVVIQTQ